MAMKPKLPTATAEQFEGLTLMRLRTEHVARTRLIDLTFDRDLTIIGGDNAQGKSSLLNSLKWCFGDKAEISLDPIHDGQQKGTILTEWGDGKEVKLNVTCDLLRIGESDFAREWRISIPGHIPPTRTAEFLKKLSGLHAFDPLEFDSQNDAQQFEALRGLVGNFDFAANKAARDRVYKERTDVGRDRDREYGAANGISIAAEPPGARIDEDALTTELRSVGEFNLDVERRKQNRENAETRIADLRRASEERVAQEEAEVADYLRQINELNDKIAQAKEARATDCRTYASEIAALQSRLDAAGPLPLTKDASEVEARLKAARETNSAIGDWERQRERKKVHTAEGEKHAKKYDQLTAQIAEIDHERQSAIEKAHLPLDGLGFGDGFITLNGKRWAQASRAEQVTASTAIAMALNPKLKVVIIRDGSNLGSTLRNQIRDMAAARGYRVLLEVVDESGANSDVYIEDGQVKEAPARKGAA
jgi:hypothetical protein